jgi:hypothetical protein
MKPNGLRNFTVRFRESELERVQTIAKPFYRGRLSTWEVIRRLTEGDACRGNIHRGQKMCRFCCIGGIAMRDFNAARRQILSASAALGVNAVRGVV